MLPNKNSKTKGLLYRNGYDKNQHNQSNTKFCVKNQCVRISKGLIKEYKRNCTETIVILVYTDGRPWQTYTIIRPQKYCGRIKTTFWDHGRQTLRSCLRDTQCQAL